MIDRRMPDARSDIEARLTARRNEFIADGRLDLFRAHVKALGFEGQAAADEVSKAIGMRAR